MNRFEKLIKSPEQLTSTNPYETLSYSNLFTLKNALAKMQDELTGLLDIAPTSLHSVRTHLAAHYNQVDSALDKLPPVKQDVITNSMDWAHDVMPYCPDTVYHMTRIHTLDTSISNAVQLGYRYLTALTFTGDDRVIAIYYKATKRGFSFVELNGALIYDNYVKDVIASGAVFVQGIPF
jgi:hypothetical protein